MLSILISVRRILRTLALYSAVVLGRASERRVVRPDGARKDGAAARRRVRAARALALAFARLILRLLNLTLARSFARSFIILWARCIFSEL